VKTLKELLTELNACDEAIKWVSDKTIEDAVKDVERGDWLLWLAKKIEIHIKPLTLAKAMCAKTVIHLMKYKKSIDAVNIAEKYGLTDEISDDDLNNAADAADAAYAASASASADAAYAAYISASIDAGDAAAAASASASAYAYASADAAYAAAYASAYASDYASDSASAYASAYADAAYAAAKRKNQLQTADICREILGELIINSVKELLS
jgi:hypothetical protein